jgi:spermidine/putrescine transport system permease protein
VIRWLRDPWRYPIGLIAVTAAYLAFSLVPIAVATAFSFNDGPSVSFWQGFSFTPWRAAFADPDLTGALRQTFRLAIPVTVVAVIGGGAFALGLDRWRGRPARTASVAMVLTFAAPEIILGVAAYMLFVVLSTRILGGNFGFFGTKAQLLGLVALQVPLAFLVMRVGTLTADPEHEDMAMDLGASPTEAVQRALLPQLWPFVVATTAIVFARSVENFVIVNALAGPPSSRTVSMIVYGGAQAGGAPALNALGVAMSVMTLTLFAIVLLVARFVLRR